MAGLQHRFPFANLLRALGSEEQGLDLEKLGKLVAIAADWRYGQPPLPQAHGTVRADVTAVAAEFGFIEITPPAQGMYIIEISGPQGGGSIYSIGVNSATQITTPQAAPIPLSWRQGHPVEATVAEGTGTATPTVAGHVFRTGQNNLMLWPLYEPYWVEGGRIFYVASGIANATVTFSVRWFELPRAAPA